MLKVSQASTLQMYMVNNGLRVWNVIGEPTKTAVVKKQISHIQLVKKKRKNEFQQKTNWVPHIRNIFMTGVFAGLSFLFYYEETEFLL